MTHMFWYFKFNIQNDKRGNSKNQVILITFLIDTIFRGIK